MSETSFWELTGEQPTYDMGAIHEIYEKAIDQNKNDKTMLIRLRKAYAGAMDEAFENTVKPQTEELLNKIDKIYSDINTRFCVELWEDIFKSDCFKNIAMFNYVRNEIMAYFLYHEYISEDVWRVLDKYLYIMRDYDDIKAAFPVTFMQRVKQVLNGESFFEFERIKELRKTDKNPDDYIQDLFEFADMVEFEKSDKKIQRHMKKLEAYGFYHIYYDVERMNYLVRTGENDDEVERLCDMLAKEENIYIQSSVGWALWYLGRADDADSAWVKVLEQMPEYKKALFGHANYLYESECYEQAKDCIFTILETYGESDDVLKLMSDINEVVMKNYLEMYEENPDDLYDGIQYAWCLCQNGQWDEVIDFLLDMDEDESVSYDVNMLLGRAYFSKEKYNQAIPYLQKWIKQMMLLPCDGSEEYKEKIERYPAALAIMSETYHETGDIEKAIYFMEQSMHAYDSDDDERFKSMTRLADFYNEVGRYDDAFEVAERVLKEDDCYVWAYTAHQKAAFETYRTPAVISDYSALSNLVPNMPEPYIYAAKVYMYNNMYDDMEIVIERAESNRVSEPQFDVMRFIISAGRAEFSELTDIEEDYESMCASKPALREFKELDTRFYLIIENKYRSASRFDDAIEYIDIVIEKEPENNYHKWEKADLYFRKNDDAKALEIYDSIADSFKNNNSFLCDYAFCMQYNDKWEESAEILKEVLQSDDTFMADAYMMRYYKNLYMASNLREYYEKARMHIDRQIEKTPDNLFAVRERMMLLNITEDDEAYETAIKDALVILENEYDDECTMHMRLAELYMKKGDYDESVKELEKSFELQDESAYSSECDILKLAAKIYERMDRRDISEKALKKAYKKDRDVCFIKLIGDCCLKRGNYRESVKWYKKSEELCNDGYLSSAMLAKAHLLNKSKISAGRIHKRILENAHFDSAAALRNVAWQCFEILIDAEKAIKYMETALKYIEQEELDSVYSALALFYRYINDDNRAKEYAEKLFEVITKEHDGSIEKYLDVKHGLLNRIDNVVLYYIGIGDFETAGRYIDRMFKGKQCSWCNEPCCTDAYTRLALIRIMQGDFDGMTEVCKALESKDSCNSQARIYMEKTEELKKQYENYR